MASSTTPTDPWLQFYQQTVPPPATSSVTGGIVSDSTVVSAVAEQRGSRPVRRRSRQSKRTPTTVFNTDPTNFRAMVQQFTSGGYSNATSPFPVQGRPPVYSLSRESPGFINFGVENGSHQIASSDTAYRQLLQLQLQQQQHHHQQQQQQDYESAYLMHRIRSYGSDVENNEPFGHK